VAKIEHGVAKVERHFDLNALYSFAMVAYLGSISKAASALELPKSTVSRHIAKLEEQAGFAVVNRQRTGVTLTLEGQRLYDATADSIANIRSAQHELLPFVLGNSHAAIKPIRVRAPIVFGRGFLGDVIAHSCAKFPAARFSLVLTERIFDPEDDRFDVSFCVGLEVPDRLEAWALGYLEAKLYASPSYAASNAVITPGDLAGCNLLTNQFDWHGQSTWRLNNTQKQSHTIHFAPKLQATDNFILLQAALVGVGICRLPEFIAQEHVSSGALIAILPDWHVDRHEVTIAAKRGYKEPQLREFLDYCASALANVVR
jgi:DNA-binding transcriptional LysR family regulator